MRYEKTVVLKDGSTCRLRNGTERDGAAVLASSIKTHEETEYLLTYADETKRSVEDEAAYLARMTASEREVELVAELSGTIVGMARISVVGPAEKVRHRAYFGVSVERAYWGRGIGRALTRACIECARCAGYAQLELEVVAENARAIALYESEGFIEYGRNPKGFRTRSGAWQELCLMRLELDER